MVHLCGWNLYLRLPGYRVPLVGFCCIYRYLMKKQQNSNLSKQLFQGLRQSTMWWLVSVGHTSVFHHVNSSRGLINALLQIGRISYASQWNSTIVTLLISIHQSTYTLNSYFNFYGLHFFFLLKSEAYHFHENGN